jgi:hypothetical protein
LVKGILFNTILEHQQEVIEQSWGGQADSLVSGD